MDNEYHNSPPDDRVSAFPPYQLERNRSEMTASPAFSQNGGSAYGPPPPPRTTASPALSTRSDARSDPRKSEERNRSRARSGGRSGSGQVRVCHKCGEQLTGQFVRALDGTFHLDCFKCRVSSGTSPLMVRIRVRLTRNVFPGLWSNRRVEILSSRR